MWFGRGSMFDNARSVGKVSNGMFWVGQKKFFIRRIRRWGEVVGSGEGGHGMCMGCVWHMHGMRVTYAWNRHAIRMEYAPIRVGDVWNMFGTRAGYVGNTCGMRMEHMEHVWNLYGKFIEYVRNMYRAYGGAYME